tara:strand:+ start:59 stop:628 length:570 start_codon:yes stop_codon:yes gene_type:complete
MKVLIVYAHPGSEGYCPMVLQQTVAKLNDKNIEFEVLNLYEMKYDPVLYPEELYTKKPFEISKQNLEIQRKIKEVEKFIFIYPVWWGTMPAILKGFFEKVFTPGFAFNFKGGVPIKLLKGKAVVINTRGSPKVATWFLGDTANKHIAKDILGFFGITTKTLSLYGATSLKDSKIEELSKLVDKAINYIL